MESEIQDILSLFGLSKSTLEGSVGNSWKKGSAKFIEDISPINGKVLGRVEAASKESYDQVISDAQETFLRWREVPAPKRGDIVRRIGSKLREVKKPLGKLVSWEVGKILAEGEGEVQEAIDIADYAVGLSRQLWGKVIASEREQHRMYEQWHPLGVVGVITAFNFPVAVWAWNAMVAAVCGDVIVWKPSELAPLSALAVNNIARSVAKEEGFEGVFSLVIGERDIGQLMASDKRVPLVSATGSCRMGRAVGEAVAKRLGKCILELGGNNAAIVMPDADMSLVERAVLFAAVGTAGQRCTTLRRLLVHKDIYEEVERRLLKAYSQIKIGNPLEEGVLLGPLIHKEAVKNYLTALERIKEEGGEVIFGGQALSNMPYETYVEPVLVRAKKDMPIVQEETFAPILYLIKVKDLEEAIDVNNRVPQGLSSAIFTKNLKYAERFLSPAGSDCGIANVNMGTSGAEIGGAFGGEKDTGGGREAGSDAWKQYVRRQTVSINYGDELPLAQGIKFG